MKKAPIAIFVYNRLLHAQKTIEALQNNEFAEESEVFIFSDAPKTDKDETHVKMVRNYIKSLKKIFKNVTIIERNTNFGLAKSFICGTTEMINNFKLMIGLEDDNYTSPLFLRFMNEALELYQDVDRVICISAYSFPTINPLPETFFIRGAETWSYATWKRGWDLFERDGKLLLQKLEDDNLIHEFDLDGAMPYSNMLKDQIEGRNDSWGVRWYASAFVNNKLTLYPGISLVQNIGFDGSGTHCPTSNQYYTPLSDRPIKICKIKIEENKYARREIANFHRTLYKKEGISMKADNTGIQNAKPQSPYPPNVSTEQILQQKAVQLANHGGHLTSQGKYAEAIRLLDEAMYHYPRIENLQYLRAICLWNLGRFEEAKIAAISEAKTFPKNQSAIGVFSTILPEWEYSSDGWRIKSSTAA